MDRVKILLGNGIMTSEGDFWRRQRRIQALAGFAFSSQAFVQARRQRVDVLAHQALGGCRITLLQRSHDVGMVVVRALGFGRALVQRRHQRGAGRQVHHHRGDQAVAQAFGQADVEVRQHDAAVARAAFCNGLAFIAHMGTQLLQHRLQGPPGIAQHARLDDAARGVGLARIFERGLHHKPALAWPNLDKTTGLQLEQRLAHAGAAHAKQVRQFLLAQAFARPQPAIQDGLDHTLGDIGLERLGHGDLEAGGGPIVHQRPG